VIIIVNKTCLIIKISVVQSFAEIRCAGHSGTSMGGMPYPMRSAENYVIIAFIWCLLCMAHGSESE